MRMGALGLALASSLGLWIFLAVQAQFFFTRECCTIYGNGYYANANTWINKDTLFVQMLQDILVNRDRGDSVGMNITVYAYDGSYIDSFILRTELIVPKDTLSNTEGTEENSGDDEDADDEDDNLDTPLDD